MTTKHFLYVLSLIAILLTSCQEEDFDIRQPDVGRFVSLLKDGSYTRRVGNELPDFTLEHIEELMPYLNDTTRIEYFPANPISSKYTSPKILSECLLWTIEGIRLKNKFPSMEPCLIDTLVYSESRGFARLSGKQLLEVSEVYSAWYAEYRIQPSEVLRSRNVLEATSFKWN